MAGKSRHRRPPGGRASQNAVVSARVLNIFQLPAMSTAQSSGIARTPGSSLPSSNSSEAPPPVETQSIRSASPAPGRPEPSRLRRPPCAPAGGHRLGDGLRPCANRGHSKTPIGPFQKTVFAAETRSTYARRVSGPMSSPSQPSGTSSAGNDLCFGVRLEGLRCDHVAAEARARLPDRPAPPSCRRSGGCRPSPRAPAGRRSCPRPWPRRGQPHTAASGPSSSFQAPPAPVRAGARRRPARSPRRPRSRRAHGAPRRRRR